ncbi:hypothetical protein ES703_108898 [subsurface metagenome]
MTSFFLDDLMAVLIANSTASPPPQKKWNLLSPGGKILESFSASSTLGILMHQGDAPGNFLTCSITALTTLGCALPTVAGPAHMDIPSIYSFPLISFTILPLASSITRGVKPGRGVEYFLVFSTNSFSVYFIFFSSFSIVRITFTKVLLNFSKMFYLLINFIVITFNCNSITRT